MELRTVCIVLAALLGLEVSAQSASDISISADSTTFSSVPASLTEIPTAASYYGDFSATITLSTSTSSHSNGTFTSTYLNATNGTSHSATSTSSATQTIIQGTASPATGLPSSTNILCNGHSEFCNRRFSNVSYVMAHNSPFSILHNAASNQVYDVTQQLNDGIRGLQSETHYVNDTVYLCHTSCNELNAGTLEAYLVTVREWLEQPRNRFEVISIFLGNEDYIDPGNYTAPFQNSGILDYVYTPPVLPMSLTDWPTLGQMILSDKRVVTMLEYDANQKQIPWLMQMFDNSWQTPFSPTNDAFPCTIQRPPGLAQATAENWMYLINHNLNTAIDLSALTGSDALVLIPDTAQINSTNANTTSLGQLGANVDSCTSQWGRPPNYLLVDYYNYGNFPGSTLAAAAKANNVSYNINSCCGKAPSSDGNGLGMPSWVPAAVASLVVLIVAL